MAVNKEDFRHFMLDSHISVGRVLLFKQSLEKRTVCLHEKTLLCLSAVWGIYCQGGHCQSQGKGSTWGFGCPQKRGCPNEPQSHPSCHPTASWEGSIKHGQGMALSHEGWARLLSAVNLHRAFDVGGSDWVGWCRSSVIIR